MPDSVLFDQSGGVDHYQFTMGSWVGSGAISVATIVKPTSVVFDGATHFPVGIDSNVGGVWGLGAEGPVGTPHFFWWDGVNARSFNIDIPAANEWYLAAMTKATGTVAPRFHQYRFSTGAWHHSNSAGTSSNSGQTLASWHIGTLSSEGWDGNILIAGLWDSELTDAQIEQLFIAKGHWGGAKEVYRLDNATTPSRYVGTSTYQSGFSTPGTLDAGDVPSPWSDTWFVRATTTANGTVSKTLNGVNNGDAIFYLWQTGSTTELPNSTPTDSAGNTYTFIGFIESNNQQTWIVYMAIHGGSNGANIIIASSFDAASSWQAYGAFAIAHANGTSSNPPCLLGVSAKRHQAVSPGTNSIVTADVASYGGDSAVIGLFSDDNNNPVYTIGAGYGVVIQNSGSVIDWIIGWTPVTADGTYNVKFSHSTVTANGASVTLALGLSSDFPGLTSQNISISADADDGGAYRTSTSSTTIQSGGGTFVDNGTVDATKGYLSWSFDTPNYYADQIYLRFNTGSVIPSGAVILWARLKLRVTNRQRTNGFDFILEDYDYGGSPPTAADFADGDYGAGATGLLGAGMDSGAIIPRTQPGLVTLPISGISVVRKSGQVNAQGNSGYTGIRGRGRQIGVPSALEFVEYALREHASQTEPILEVGWYVPADSYVPAGEAGPTLIRLIGNRQRW